MALAVPTSSVVEVDGDAASITATEPASTAQGDLLIAWPGVDDALDAYPVNLNTGWTEIDDLISSPAGAQAQMGPQYIVRGASAPDLVFTHDEAHCGIAILARITGAAASPIGAVGHTYSSGTTVTCPSITTTVPNSIVFFSFVTRLSNAPTEDANYPTSTTGLFFRETVSADDDVTMGVAWQSFASVGATGTKTWTISTSENWTASSIEVVPPSAVGAAAMLALL